MKKLITAVLMAIAITSVIPAQDARAATGAALYAAECEVCHGILANSTKMNRTAAQIQSAINGNVGGMGYLTYMTAADVQATAAALANGAPAPVTGPALYGSYCAGCHGTLASSSKKNRTAAQTQAAINGNVGGMGGLKTLTAAQVQLIASALAGTAPAPTPTPAPAPAPAPGVDCTALYGTSCAGCHNALASSTKKNRTAAQIQNAITGNAGGMGYLSTLTAAQVQAIAKALAPAAAPAPTPAPAPKPTPTPAPTPAPAPGAGGAALYGTNCASCHNPLASSNKKNRTAAQIQSAITGNVCGMGYLKTLTAAQVQAIATALAPAAPVTNPAAPVNVSVTAAAGAAGTAQQLSAVWSDTNGAANIMLAMIQVGTAASGGIAKVKYDQVANKLYLMNDAGTAWTGGFAPGSVNNIANSRVTLNCAKTTVTKSGNNLTVSFNLKPAAGYTGGKPLFLYAYDKGMLAPKAWDMKGTWKIGAAGTAPVPAPAPGIDGAALYGSGCAGCHGPLATSTKKNRTAAQIQNAITANAGGMGTASLKALSTAQVAAIAAALAGSTPPSTTPPPVITDGATLYGNNCAACHGALANSGVKGSSASSIQSAITKNKGGMGYLGILTPAQVAAIAGVL